MSRASPLSLETALLYDSSTLLSPQSGVRPDRGYATAAAAATKPSVAPRKKTSPKTTTKKAKAKPRKTRKTKSATKTATTRRRKTTAGKKKRRTVKKELTEEQKAKKAEAKKAETIRQLKRTALKVPPVIQKNHYTAALADILQNDAAKGTPVRERFSAAAAKAKDLSPEEIEVSYNGSRFGRSRQLS